MIFHLIAAVAAASAIGVNATPSNDGACWQIIGAALDHSAHSSHARFISYGEQSVFSADGRTLNTFNSSITYRDDGMAYIDDARWTNPMISEVLEPGPPVLGPYGASRSAWLSLDNASNTKLPVIAHVYAHPNESCRDAGIQMLAGRASRHLIVGADEPDRRGLHEMWLDTNALDVVRVVIRAPVHFLVQDSPVQRLANYVIDIQNIVGHPVLRKVTWSYRDRQNGQWTDLAGEYNFHDFRFTEVEPPGTFSATTAASKSTLRGTR